MNIRSVSRLGEHTVNQKCAVLVYHLGFQTCKYFAHYTLSYAHYKIYITPPILRICVHHPQNGHSQF